MLAQTLFEQTFRALHDRPPHLLRRRDRGFKVKFVGEASDDYGGPYREAVTNCCAELQSRGSPLLLLSPNGQADLGNNRASWCVRPQASSPLALQQFFFLGQLMACALLQTQMVLDLELCPHVWKRLAGVQLDESDLISFDEASAKSLRWIKHCDATDGIDEDSFGDIIFDCFEVRRSDATAPVPRPRLARTSPASPLR